MEAVLVVVIVGAISSVNAGFRNLSGWLFELKNLNTSR